MNYKKFLQTFLLAIDPLPEICIATGISVLSLVAEAFRPLVSAKKLEKIDKDFNYRVCDGTVKWEHFSPKQLARREMRGKSRKE